MESSEWPKEHNRSTPQSRRPQATAVTMEKSSPPPPPPDYPPQVRLSCLIRNLCSTGSTHFCCQAEKDYERVRVIGSGAFGQVILAKRRQGNTNTVEEYVAIKGVNIRTENEGATAAREIAILSELSHPNIIKLLDAYEPASDTAKGRYMVMALINGPDVRNDKNRHSVALFILWYPSQMHSWHNFQIGELLEKRGALGLPLARLVARHLISAVAYLHARGVMHR